MDLRRRWLLIAVPFAALLAVACGGVPRPGPRPLDLKHWPTRKEPIPGKIHKIKHVVIIMQENRSFDSYFGTYPGADGIPASPATPAASPALPTRSGTPASSRFTTDRTAT